jgi:hypothetical protein
MLPLRFIPKLADVPEGATWFPELRGTIADTDKTITSVVIIAIRALYLIKTSLKFKYLIITSTKNNT